MKERPSDVELVIIMEMKPLLDKRGMAVIRSSMLLKDKYLASGAFDKFKARHFEVSDADGRVVTMRAHMRGE